MTASIPPAARWLGFAGLLPFLGAVMAGFIPALAAPVPPTGALIAYGAVILSFLGGIRWGLAMSTPSAARRLPLSVVPSLLAWVALLLPSAAGLMLLAVGFAAVLWADLHLPEAPKWYPRLRLPLSCGAIACLLLGLVR